MRYIVHRRFKGKAICGDVNIPAMSECKLVNNIIYYNNKPICSVTSENAHQYFACDHDNEGMLRGKLTQEIQKKLSKRDNEYQVRWNKIWEDSISQKYKRDDHKTFWLWNHEFFGAHIFDLQHIASLIGVII